MKGFSINLVFRTISFVNSFLIATLIIFPTMNKTKVSELLLKTCIHAILVPRKHLKRFLLGSMYFKIR